MCAGRVGQPTVVLSSDIGARQHLIWRRCFYCRQWCAPREVVRRGTLPLDRLVTRDHVVPRWMVRALPAQSDRWYVLNRVFACHGCNCRKGGMLPLDFADTLPLDAATRLRSRVELLSHQFDFARLDFPPMLGGKSSVGKSMRRGSAPATYEPLSVSATVAICRSSPLS